MSYTLLLDTEAGYTSVLDEIESGRVKAKPIRSYNDADKAIWDLIRGSKTDYPKALVLDSFTTLADRAIEEIKLPMSQTTAPGTIWLEVEKVTGFAATQPEWGKLASALFRLCWNVETWGAENGIPFLLTCGEELREDGPRGAKMFGPDVSPKVRGFLMHYADCIGRIGVLDREQELKDLDGKIKKFPAGTRVLRLAPSTDFHAKCRVRRANWGKFLEVLPNPTLARLQETVGYTPNRILVYGPAGAGKTTFVCSSLKEEETK